MRVVPYTYTQSEYNYPRLPRGPLRTQNTRPPLLDRPGPHVDHVKTIAHLTRPSCSTPTPFCLAATPYRYFFALARTRASNTVLRIGVCAVWNGLSIV